MVTKANAWAPGCSYIRLFVLAPLSVLVACEHALDASDSEELPEIPADSIDTAETTRKTSGTAGGATMPGDTASEPSGSAGSPSSADATGTDNPTANDVPAGGRTSIDGADPIPLEPDATSSLDEVPVGDVVPDSGEPGAVALDEPGEPETFPDVPDPVFEDPWFPCPETDYPEHAVVVKAHDQVVHTYESTTIDVDVELPEGSFKAVALRVEHECPTGGICDLYDRRAVVELADATDTEAPGIALMRYVTTYRFVEGQTNTMCSWTDVTDYASLLKGRQTIRSWLDTVVSPGHELGDGWQVSTELVFYPGPAPEPVQVQELYGRFVNIGEAPGSIDEETPPITVDIPPDASQVVAVLTVSGHGWGPENTDNCAEFCRLDQTISVGGGEPHVINTFRDDCAQNPLAPLQQRNPTGSRNGWCPGAVVLPNKIDITDEVTPGMPVEIDFGVQLPNGSEYIDADPTGYNPNEYVSLQIMMSSGGSD